MDTKKLRQKILDLAIRGKLVPQDPNDEPASVLLERIRAEKERLIKEGKIKRSKKSASDDEIEAPFEIPESWEWTTIEDLLINRDSERVPLSLAIRKKQTNKIYDYYGAAGVIDKVDGYLFSERLLLIGEDGANLLSRSKDNAFFAEGQYWVNNHAHVLDCSEKYILDFVAFVINSMSLEKYVTGSAQPKLTQDNLNKIIISLPPKEEQRRIINAVERWFTLIDELESNEGDLLKAIDKTKSKILDLAIHGKLVPQDPNDEPASVLLQKIREEKQQLVKAGKLKKKDLEEIPINDEDVPFKIPDSWKWTTIGEIASSILYGVSESAKDSGKYKLLRITDIQNNTVNWQTVPFTDFDDIKALPYLLQDGDILFARTGATVGKSYLVEGVSQPSIYASYLIRVQTSNLILPLYIKMFFDSRYYWEQITTNSVGIGQPNVNGTILAGLAIPTPPYQEQIRIVARIEELFAVLDSIKESLES